MPQKRWINSIALVLALLCLLAPASAAQDQPALIADDEIVSLRTQLAEAVEASSSARKKLAIRRVIRAGEGLIEDHATAPNRFEVLHVLFGAQQQLIGIDNTASNRTAFLDTCRALTAAPDDYAALRLDADLLLSQAELAQKGADQQARAEALKPLVQRYLETEVATKVIRIALIMAIEMGDADLIGYLREVIAEHFPSDQEMINFQRDQLAGQVFGAPFVGTFEGADGKIYRFPMDGMGKTTAMYFWTKEGDGLEQLKLIAEGWQKIQANPDPKTNAFDADNRYQFISFNLDGLPDAGESLLREIGVDWLALHLPGGRESNVYQTYVRNDPKLLTMTPTGYTAMVMSGATRIRPDRTWERNFQSALARFWTKHRYTNQFQSLLIGEFLVIDPTGDFDPAAPPECKALSTGDSQQPTRLTRTAKSVPEEKLKAIQACFVNPPLRYRLTLDKVKANYTKADALCQQAIEQHPDADDLWIVRNRRIVALMGLWKATGNRKHFDTALEEAQAAMEQGYPKGTDVVARFCLAKQALRTAEDDLPGVIKQFVQAHGEEPVSTTTYAAASLLALEIADRPLHEHYRRLSLDKHANHPMLWNATSFLLDRYHRYWLYHPPFTAGWTYGRRMGYFLTIGTPEDADRTLELELKTLEGESIRLPEASDGKWTVIEFRPDAEVAPHFVRHARFVDDRFTDDVNLVVAVLNDDPAAASDIAAKHAEQLKKGRQEADHFQTLFVPGGMSSPVVEQLGILDEDTRPNIVVVQPDGQIAVMLSGLTMSVKGNTVLNVIQQHDEQLVDEALARGDLDEAKRLAFTHAPIEQIKPEDAPKNWKPRALTVPHLRARAKVYMAMKDWDAAFADAEEVYLQVKKKAGHISMRTEDLAEMEDMLAHIQSQLDQRRSDQ